MPSADSAPQRSQRRTIVHFSQDFAPGKPQLGGFSRIYNLCRDGNDHHIFTLSREVGEVRVHLLDGIRVITLPASRSAVKRADQLLLVEPIARALAGYLRKHGIVPDLLFGHSQLFNFFVLYRARAHLATRPKILWEANAIWGIQEAAELKSYVAHLWNRLLQASVFKRTDAIVFQTCSSRDYAVSRFQIPLAKCTVITNAVDLEVTHAGAVAAPKRDRGNYTIGCIGLFDDLNGVGFLVQTLDGPPPPNLRLVFAGKGKHLAEVERFAARGFGDYLGVLPFAEMQRRLAEFDFLIIPRRRNIYSELYIPTKLLEAMALGVVPICSDVGGLREVVEHGVDGLLFAADDPAALREALRATASMPREIRDRLADAARAKVASRFDYTTNHAQFGALYDRLLSPSSR